MVSYGAEPFEQQQFAPAGVEGVNRPTQENELKNESN